MNTALQQKLHILTHTTTEEHQYDPEKALEAYRVILPLLPTSEESRRGFSHGYTCDEYPSMTDEDRIVTLFELLNGSILGDEIFSGMNCDAGSELSERAEDA